MIPLSRRVIHYVQAGILACFFKRLPIAITTVAKSVNPVNDPSLQLREQLWFFTKFPFNLAQSKNLFTPQR